MGDFVLQHSELSFIVVVAIALGASPFLQRLIGRLALRIAIRTETVIDDLIVDSLRPFRFVYAIPTAIAYYLADWMEPYGYELRLVSGLFSIYLGAETAIKAMSATAAVIRHKSGAKGVSSTGYIDLLKILAVLVGLAFAASVTLDTDVFNIIAGLGAATAVAGFIFKDTLHSLFVGIKIASWNLIREGDWLAVPSFDADGTVEHIGLYDIKIRNWDQTTSLVPTHKILEVANKNYASMSEARARQIVAKFMFDIKTIRLCDAELLERLGTVTFISDEVAEKLVVLGETEASGAGPQVAVKVATNYELFCLYVDRYLRTREDLHQRRYYILVRTLEPTNHGLPMQLFAFTRETGMVEFSNIQSSIFSHIIVMADIFDLKLFQFREED